MESNNPSVNSNLVYVHTIPNPISGQTNTTEVNPSSNNEITLADQNQSSGNLSATGDAVETSIMPEQIHNLNNSPRRDTPVIQGFIIDSSSRNPSTINRSIEAARCLTALGMVMNAFGLVSTLTSNPDRNPTTFGLGIMTHLIGIMLNSIAVGLYCKTRNQERPSNPNNSPVLVLDPDDNLRLGISASPLSTNSRETGEGGNQNGQNHV